MHDLLKTIQNKMMSRASDEQVSAREPLEGSRDDNTNNQVPTRPSTVYILFVGRHRCGRTDLVKICHEAMNLPQGVDFRLLGASSYDHPERTEIEIHTRIADQILEQESNNQPISGIVYCHPVEDKITSGVTQRNMRVLVELFLGRQELNRLTILVLPNEVDNRVEAVATKLGEKKSMVFSEALDGGANVVAVKQVDDIVNNLRRFSRLPPFSPPVCRAITDRIPVQRYVENALGYFGRQSMESLHQELVDTKQALETQIVHYRAEHGAAYDRLRQTEREYASLRSQVQLQNSYEQGEIIQDLNKINDMIERLGQNVSEYLVDTYVQRALNKRPQEATVSDAHDFSHFKAWLQGHREQMCLLPDLGTSGGDAGGHMNVDNFLEFFVRARLCNILSEKMFKPFHPFIETTESSELDGYYIDIRKQEHQYTSGKWRSITFRMLGTRLNLHKTSAVSEYMREMVQQFVGDFLKPLAKYFFGLSEISLGDRHYSDLYQVFQAAWEWNSRIKTDVIMLGDFHPTASLTGSFDSTSMMEFETDSHAPYPKFALCTLGLGLVSSQAKGGGILPDEVVLLKTTVLTEAYYTST
ncbi:unnamed protein product [Rhizoctonia solani]|uniref:Uncharacterized protein n=1 Tax=Rhizoctonia solani TaxID=456999 RepID=A0A8H3AK03_9AGAM|nr:unnamed protein product [Rhizoctonia solani]